MFIVFLKSLQLLVCVFVSLFQKRGPRDETAYLVNLRPNVGSLIFPWHKPVGYLWWICVTFSWKVAGIVWIFTLNIKFKICLTLILFRLSTPTLFTACLSLLANRFNFDTNVAVHYAVFPYVRWLCTND